MRPWSLRNQPIQYALYAFTFLSIATSLFLAFTGIWIYELTNYRDRLVQEVIESATFISANVAPSLLRQDSKIVHETLQAMKVFQPIRMAVIYTPTGQVVEYFKRKKKDSIPPFPQTVTEQVNSLG